jgi:ribosomal protein S18 acetylase RimI-like enzyme
MLEYAITKAKNKLKKVLWLGVWERNRRAIDFYSRFGFQKFGEHVFMVGNDAQTDWLMKLDI